MYWLLEKTIISLLTALIILAFKKLIGKKANSLWHYYIWFILFIQLLLPTLPKSNFSIGTVIPFQEINNSLNLTYDNKIFMSLNMENLVIIIWIFGVLCCLTYFIFKYLIFKKNIKKLIETDSDEVLFAFENVKNKLKINRNIPIFEYNDIPMIVGYLRPVLLLPKKQDCDELRILFYHELNHYKYFDTLINWIAIFTCCLFWFNPIVWYSFKLMQNDCEMACDYRVIKSMDVKNRKLYANALLKYAAMHMLSSDDIPVLGVPSMADSKSEIKKRIHHIINFKKYSKLNTFSITALTLIISLTCLTTVNINAELFTFIPPAYHKIQNFSHTFKTNSSTKESIAENTTAAIISDPINSTILNTSSETINSETNFIRSTPPVNFEPVMINKNAVSTTQVEINHYSESNHHSNKKNNQCCK